MGKKKKRESNERNTQNDVVKRRRRPDVIAGLLRKFSNTTTNPHTFTHDTTDRLLYITEKRRRKKVPNYRTETRKEVIEM